MSSKMLIDASHAEETRVVITKGNKIEDFDFESEHKKQIRGNIYLAKVTRVEPSLQAAFVEYGGNRHGFLAFSEIHPDYYQIPVADREALLREYQRELEADADEDDEAVDATSEAEGEEDDRPAKAKRRSRRGGRSRRSRSSSASDVSAADASEDNDATGADADGGTEAANDGDPDVAEMAVEDESVSEDAPSDEPTEEKPKRRTTRRKKAASSESSEDGTTTASDSEPQDAKPSQANASKEAAAEKPKRRSRRKKADAEKPAETADAEGKVDAEALEAEAKPKRRTSRRKKASTAEAKTADADASADETAAPTEAAGAEAPTSESTDVTETTADALALNEAEGGTPTDATEEKPKKRRTSRRRKKDDAPTEEASEAVETEAKEVPAEQDGEPEPDAQSVAVDEDEEVEETGAEDALEEAAPRRQRTPRKQYKIQEVIKRRQILLVQVTKEERGNKGAALTTYLSLAGRYSVLMPNTARGGGISRKIANTSDRRRLKDIAKSLDVPEGMGVILRTAAAARTEQEVVRDFDYLMRLWDSVRELTLKSAAPALVYEEGNLIKRSIRDLYNKDIGDIIVAGERGYREAKDFMKMLMPSQARVVKRWEKRTPLLAAHGVEAELDRMLQPSVTLKSGGYIIINQTEALVAIDVNSGRATREHSIEATALQTNLEAAEEVARQLRLRDLAGLIVIDFIDMDEKRNNRAVEKKLKDCLKDDRARIQLGRISSFGLLEMSRQRMRSSVLEATMQTCDRCGGTGHVRSASSISLQVTRAIEEQLRKNPNHDVIAKTDTATALYLLNNMRGYLADLEAQHGVTIRVEVDGSLSHQSFQVERGSFVERAEEQREGVRQDASLMDDEETPVAEEPVARLVEANEDDGASDDDDGRNRRRRGRRGGRGRANGRDRDDLASDGDDERADIVADEAEQSVDDDEKQERRPRRSRRRRSEEQTDAPTESATPSVEGTSEDGEQEEAQRSPRRSTRRRRAPIADTPRTDPSDETDASNEDSANSTEEPVAVEASLEDRPDEATTDSGAAPSRGRSTRRRKAPVMPSRSALSESANDMGENAKGPGEDGSAAPSDMQPSEPARPTRRRTSRRPATATDTATDGSVIEAVAAADGTDEAPATQSSNDASGDRPDEEDGENGGKKRSWWQRGFF